MILFSNDPEFDSFWDPVVDITSKKNENFQNPKVVENFTNEGSGDAASVERIDATAEPSLESSGSSDDSSNDVAIGDRGFQPDFDQSESQDLPLNPVHKVVRGTDAFLKTESERKCKQICSKVEWCQAYTYYPDGGCSLKTNESGTFQTQCHECITGFFGEGKRFLGKTSGFSLMGGGHKNDQIKCKNYDVEIEYEGHMKEMIENFNRYQIINESTGYVIKTQNAKDCNFICARTKSCGSWSYNGNSHGCDLKYGTRIYPVYCSSGQLDCTSGMPRMPHLPNMYYLGGDIGICS